MNKKYPKHEITEDIESGINFNRRVWKNNKDIDRRRNRKVTKREISGKYITKLNGLRKCI